MTHLILGNLFSLVSSLFLLISIFSKNKRNMVKLQIFDSSASTIASLILGGFSGAVVCGLSFLRNVLVYFHKNNKISTWLLILFMILIGIYFNNQGLIGYLPIIASVQYTIFIMSENNNVTILKCSLLANNIMWLLYSISIYAIPSAINSIFLMVSAIIAIYKDYKSKTIPSLSE